MPESQSARRVEEESAHLRKELGLTDLVLTQILYVIGLSWVGVAAKLGNEQIPIWLIAMALFYVPQALVVMHLSRRFPLEGGLYQWSKLGLNGGIAFLVGWNLWIYAIVLLGALGLSVANATIYAIGPSAEWLSGNKMFIGAVTGVTIGSLIVLSIIGLKASKWVHNISAVFLLIAFAVLLGIPIVKHATGSLPEYHPFAIAAPALTLFNLNVCSKLAVGGLSGFEYVAVLAGETKDASRNIGKSVVIAAPIIAFLFIMGTSAVQAIVPIAQVDLVGPIPQAFRVGLGGTAFGLIFAPFAVFMIASRLVANSSVLFTATTRMPMVAGWDHLLPGWFAKLSPKYRTPINSIVFIGGCSLVFAALGMTNVGEQEAFQLLDNAAGIFYGLTYLALFAIPIVGLRGYAERVPVWLKVFATVGFLTTAGYVVLTAVPIVSVVSRVAFAVKISGLVIVANAIGVGLYLKRRR